MDSFENAQVCCWSAPRAHLPWPLIPLVPMSFEDRQRKAAAVALALEYLMLVGSVNAFLNLRNWMPLLLIVLFL